MSTPFSALDILFLVFASIALVQLVYYLFLFARFAFYKPKLAQSTQQPISVIICAKNEADNLRRFLPDFLEQDYPEYEILVINHNSYDDTEELLEQMVAKYAHLKVIKVKQHDQFWRGKKYPLTLGIKAAKYNNLLFTDGDCKPASKYWVAEMAKGYQNNKEIVLGYGGYEKRKSLLNLIIQFDTVHTATQYFSYALAGLPYMGVGRNLAYNRELFFAHKGFAKHMHIPSGDDDLFINETATKKNASISITQEAFTLSEPKTKWADWYKQKRRHLSTSKYYKPKFKWRLGLYGISQILFYVLFALLLALGYNWQWVLIVFGARLLMQYLVFGLSAAKLKSKEILWILPFAEIILLAFQTYIMVANKIKPNHRWG